jgi:hypothetical protein
MKSLFKLLFGGFMLRLAGAVALGLVIWFAGPLVAFAQWHPLESENVRLATIAVVLVLWLGKRLLTLLRQKLFNRKLLDAMVPAPPRDTSGKPTRKICAWSASGLPRLLASCVTPASERSRRPYWAVLRANSNTSTSCRGTSSSDLRAPGRPRRC